jgi:hypothetical protein
MWELKDSFHSWWMSQSYFINIYKHMQRVDRDILYDKEKRDIRLFTSPPNHDTMSMLDSISVINNLWVTWDETDNIVLWTLYILSYTTCWLVVRFCHQFDKICQCNFEWILESLTLMNLNYVSKRKIVKTVTYIFKYQILVNEDMWVD